MHVETCIATELGPAKDVVIGAVEGTEQDRFASLAR
jgi:hypothetical protein